MCSRNSVKTLSHGACAATEDWGQEQTTVDLTSLWISILLSSDWQNSWQSFKNAHSQKGSHDQIISCANYILQKTELSLFVPSKLTTFLSVGYADEVNPKAKHIYIAEGVFKAHSYRWKNMLLCENQVLCLLELGQESVSCNLPGDL